MRKTSEMEKLELRDWTQRLADDPQAQRRDIREIIQCAFGEGCNLEGAAAIIGVHPGTLSVWINKYLQGDIRSHVVFSGFPADDACCATADSAA